MSIISSIRFAFRRPVSPLSADQLEGLEAQIDKDVVMRFSTGSIRLQRGEYITQEDVDMEYEHAKTLKFSETKQHARRRGKVS